MRHALGWICGLLLVVLAGGGVWLIVAPFIVGYQQRGDDWMLATQSDVITGVVVVGVSLLTLGGCLGLQLRARLRAAMAASVESGAPAGSPRGG